jgi:hypothetical protein
VGLNTLYLEFIEKSIKSVYPNAAKNLQMLELGDQVIDDPNLSEKTGKEYFTKQGYIHKSVDLNGLNGSIIRDLTKPEQFHDWKEQFDILTNAGTTEHVEPFESQYECFKIIHDCLAVGGVAIHLVPEINERKKNGAWKNHCRYYYSESFFEFLAKNGDYDLILNTVINGLRCVALKKNSNIPFNCNRAKFLANITQLNYVKSPKEIIRSFLRNIGIGKFLRRLGLR